MKSHKLDTVSLIFGGIFTMLGLAFVGFANPWRSLLIDVQWSWFGPFLLVLLGLVVLAPLLRRSQSNDTVPAEHPGAAPESAIDELLPDPLD